MASTSIRILAEVLGGQHFCPAFSDRPLPAQEPAGGAPTVWAFRTPRPHLPIASAYRIGLVLHVGRGDSYLPAAAPRLAPFESNMLLYIFDLMGVAVFAISGALAASRKALDLFGVLVIAAITAIGGGTLRDLLLNHHPIFWMLDPTYLVVICVAALLTVGYLRHRPAPGRALLVADSLGLALFAISGASIAEAAGHAPLIVVLLGTMTAVAGGVLRDVLTAEVPLILQRDIYATAAITGVSIYLLLQWLGVPQPTASIVGMVAVVLLRLLAIVRGLSLPVIRLPEDPSSPP